MGKRTEVEEERRWLSLELADAGQVVASRPEEVGHQVVHVPGRKLFVLLLMREDRCC
jgi:hypothetical protein